MARTPNEDWFKAAAEHAKETRTAGGPVSRAAATMTNPAYIDGLKMLARREQSEAQIRQRLARKGYDPAQIDDAVARLRESRAIDDDRVADAIARTEILLKRHGKLRVRRQIEQAGISKPIAARAVRDGFVDLDPDALLEAALAKRLRGRTTIADDKEFQRLYRYLVAQGFESDRVLATLSRRRRRDGEE